MYLVEYLREVYWDHLVYINDLPDVELYMFADATKLYRTITLQYITARSR